MIFGGLLSGASLADGDGAAVAAVDYFEKGACTEQVQSVTADLIACVGGFHDETLVCT